jgi:hypothetical protein
MSVVWLALQQYICILTKLTRRLKIKRRWEFNTETNFKEVGCEDVDWIHMSQGKNLVAQQARSSQAN